MVFFMSHCFSNLSCLDLLRLCKVTQVSVHISFHLMRVLLERSGGNVKMAQTLRKTVLTLFFLNETYLPYDLTLLLLNFYPRKREFLTKEMHTNGYSHAIFKNKNCEQFKCSSFIIRIMLSNKKQHIMYKT